MCGAHKQKKKGKGTHAGHRQRTLAFGAFGPWRGAGGREVDEAVKPRKTKISMELRGMWSMGSALAAWGAWSSYGDSAQTFNEFQHSITGITGITGITALCYTDLNKHTFNTESGISRDNNFGRACKCRVAGVGGTDDVSLSWPFPHLWHFPGVWQVGMERHRGKTSSSVECCTATATSHAIVGADGDNQRLRLHWTRIRALFSFWTSQTAGQLHVRRPCRRKSRSQSQSSPRATGTNSGRWEPEGSLLGFPFGVAMHRFN